MSNAKEKLSRIKDYLADLSVQWKTHAATEHSYRAALQSLLADLIPGVTVVNEPAHIACGAPDLLVRSNAATHAPVGYVETKDIDDGDLDGNGKNKEQFDRYKADLDNLVFTDYLDFRFYVNSSTGLTGFTGLEAGENPVDFVNPVGKHGFVEAVRIASIVGGNIVPAAESELERFAALVDFFGAAKPKPITSPTRLAALMAGKARLLARSISAALTADKEGTTPLAHQMEVFRRVLIHDLTPEAFADIYAQTITYGMFAARLHDQTPEDFSRVEAAQLLPKTNPLLRKLFLGLENDLDPTVEWIVDDLVALFAASDVAAILKDYGKSTEKTDPILHFYEDFLTAYNPTFRGMRWHLLQTFDEIYVLNLHGNSMKKETAPDGSKDENVFDIMVGTSINIFVKRGDRKTTDSADSKIRAIRGSKPLATVRYADLYGKREDKYAFLEAHALDDVGFQVVAPTAPFCFFCPKDETGRAEYERGFKLDELMPLTTSGFVSANDVVNISFTEEEQQKKIADLIQMPEGSWRTKYNRQKDSRDWTWATARDDAMKHPDCAATVCYRPFDVRHTTYTGNSRGLYSSPQQNVMSQFLKGENVGLCAIRISSRDNHCAAFVCDGITDKTILSSKDNANVFPLYLYSENMGKVERRANFDAGIYGKICAAVRVGSARVDASNVAESRLAFYRAHELGKTWYDVIEPTEILSLKPVMVESVDPAADRRTAKEIFRKMQPARNTADGRVVRFTVRAAKKLLFHKEINLFELCASFGRLFAASRRAWSETAAEIPCHRKHPNIDAYHHYIAKAHFGGVLYYVRFTVREDVRSEAGNEFHGTMVTRVCVYKAESAEQSLRAHAHGEGSALLKATDTGLSLRSHTHGESPVPFVDNKIALFLAAVNEGAKGSEEFGVKREDLREVGERAVDPEDVFNYIYGVLHTPSYRERYAEFLKVDFPRIPYPKDADEFRRIAGIGAELVSVHLLRSPKLSDMFASEATFPVAGSNRIEAVKRDDGRVYVNAKQYFDNVPEAAWNAYVGGYQPAQKWLKDRKGRTLTADDVLHYKSIVLALLETGRLTAML